MLRVDNSNITYSRHCAIRQQRQHISKKKQRCRILTKRKKMEGKKITFTFLYIFQCHDTACGCATAVAIATTSGIMFTSSSYITPPTRGGGRTTTTTAAEQDKERPPPPRPSTNRKKSRSSQLEMLSAMPRSDQILASIRRRRTSTAVEVDDGSPQSPLLPHRLDNSPPQQAGDDESIVTTRSSRSRGSSSTSSSANHNNHNNDLTVSVSEEQQEADDDEESYKEQPQEEEEDNDEESTAEDEDDDEDDDEYEEKKEQSKAAMIPVNVIVPYKEFCWTMERCFKCPKCNKRRLEVSQETFGFATELYIDCQKCSYAIAVSPLNSMRSWKKTRNKDDHHQQQQQPRQDNDEEDNEEDPPNNNTSTRRNSRFMDYAINYSASLLMQHLGMGLRGVTTMLAFLGIAAGVGNKDKWKKLQDEVGMTEEAVAGVVMDNNLKEEIKLTRKAAEEAYKTWLLTDAGRSASPQIQANKMNELLCIRVGHDNRLKVGLSIGMDGAWQKRSIGKGLYNSKTGHNYGVGGHTKKILSIVAYSKHCYTCDRAIKSGVEPPIHRCAKNFDCDKSSKAMEPLAAVDHCKNLAGKNEDDLQCYISQLITDDDSTTRCTTLKTRVLECSNIYYEIRTKVI